MATREIAKNEDREIIKKINRLQADHEKEEEELCFCDICAFSRALKGGLEKRAK
ncbi:MAG TPA: hypothetical protein P5548_01400 [Candidatus Moranbacteria bacterium]|nr:hypothetical protein [Candidatus Moranbacteria bacterium]HRZ33545.1 hypothetical protein [Candidatus Moranbacteria bacterium]